jgi:outer membrane receptor for ferrienterochelin and colicin
MPCRHTLLRSGVCLTCLILAHAAWGADTTTTDATTANATTPTPATTTTDLNALQVTIHKHLEDARNEISTQTGTSAYKIDDQAIAALPQGDNTSFDNVLEQSPGVAKDSFGQVHIRGEHADLQYRLNGLLLPEGISGFGQVLDSRIIQSSTLLTGALPAQYGYRTAGVVDIQTRTGGFGNGGEATVFGGSNGTIEPSIEYGGNEGNLNYFFTGSHLTSDDGIESPTGNRPQHDHTEQDKQFGYMSYLLDDNNQVSLIAGNSLGHFQLPNNPNQPPQFTLDGASNFTSSQLNERQFESNQYATIAWQGAKDNLGYQIAPYVRYSELHYLPDPIGDLVFNGVASNVLRTDTSIGIQADGSDKINSTHTLRSGFMIQHDQAVSNNSSSVFAIDPVTGITATTPETIVDNSAKGAELYGVYLQDEWKLTPQLTMNYGGRFDVSEAYLNESQLSPRLGLVYKLDSATTLHGGYARYFTPPPLELVAPTSISLFNNTTAQAANPQDDPVKSERTHSFDLGATHQLTDEIQLGIDGYYKMVHNMLDEGQFGQALVFTPFNYQHGQIYGTELTGSYTTKTIKAYGNFAVSRAMGTDITSAQFNFDPAELAYINSNWVHLDHDQTYTASSGISYQVLPKTSLSVDNITGSGLRKGFANTESLPWYSEFDLGAVENLDLFPTTKTDLRFSIINVFDSIYELRDGSGIGVGAPQFGPRRGFFMGITQGF